MVSVRKRGQVYQYQFDIALINGKRKRVTKSRFKTKAEAEKTGTKAYNEFLNTGTSVKLNSFIIELCSKYKFSKAYFSNILKGSFREARDVYGFIKYNPTLTLRLPKIEADKEDIKHLYSQQEIYMCFFNSLLYWNENRRGICINLE